MPAKTIVLFQGGRPEASAAAATAGRGQSQPGKHLYLSVDTIAQRSHNILPSCLAGQREERGGERGRGGVAGKWIARWSARSVFQLHAKCEDAVDVSLKQTQLGLAGRASELNGKTSSISMPLYLTQEADWLTKTRLYTVDGFMMRHSVAPSQ